MRVNTLLKSVFKDISLIKKVSALFFIIVVWLFMLFRTELFFPTKVAQMRLNILIYLVAMAVIFALPDLRSRLTDMPFLKTLKTGLKYAFISFGLLYVISWIIGLKHGFGIGSLAVNLWYGFFVAVTEETIFRKTLADQFGVFWSGVFFVSFHRLFVVGIFGAFILFCLHVIWWYMQKKTKNPATNIGSHYGYDVFVRTAFEGGISL